MVVFLLGGNYETIDEEEHNHIYYKVTWNEIVLDWSWIAQRSGLDLEGCYL